MHLQPFCQLIKNCFCIKPQEFNLEDINAQIRHWFGTVGWFVQPLGGTFRQESDYPRAANPPVLAGRLPFLRDISGLPVRSLNFRVSFSDP